MGTRIPRHLSSRRLVALLLLSAAVTGLWYYDPLEPRLDGRRDSDILLSEIREPHRTLSQALLRDQLGLERYVRALIKIYDTNQDSAWSPFRGGVRDRWLRMFEGRWPALDQTIWNELTDHRREERLLVRGSVIGKLREVGYAATPALPLLIRHIQKRPIDPYVIQIFGEIGPQASSAIPVLLQIGVKSDEPVLLRTVANSLRQISPGLENRVVPAAIEGLASTNERVRAASADLLGWLGPPAAEAVPKLEDMRSDPWRMVRDAANGAVGRIQALADR